MQKLLASKPVRLTRAQIETLAICSYRQPVTRPEIDEIRGVDSGGTLKTLLDRSLIRIVGKKEEPGRPILYGTTREFLEFFNLRDLKDLPTLREFHELSEEHLAQVAALEGVAPEGSIEREGEEAAAAAADGPPPLTRLEITTPPEDERELEEIDRLIRTAGVATDADQPAAAEARRRRRRGARRHPEEFEHQPTREFDPIPGEPTREYEPVAGEPTRIHANTIPTPEIARRRVRSLGDDEQEAAPRRARRRRRRDHDAAPPRPPPRPRTTTTTTTLTTAKTKTKPPAANRADPCPR